MVEKIVVIGAGLMGASTAYHLAILAKEHNQPVDITVLEHSPEGVQRGGSMGTARITRLNTRDVPPVCLNMIVESNQLAHKLGCVTPVNALTIGNRKDKLAPAREVARAQAVRHSVLDARGIRQKYPFIDSAGLTAVDEEAMTPKGDGAGTVNPEMLIQKMLEEAKKAGAIIHYNTDVTKISEDESGVTVTTSEGNTSRFDKAVTATGVWTSKLLGKEHPVTEKFITTVEPLYLFKMAEGHKVALHDLPVVMMKIKGGNKFARQHPDFVARQPRFAEEDATFQAYIMAEPFGADLYLKIGIFVPLEKTPQDPDRLLHDAKVTPEQHQLAADVIGHFMPGIAPHLPSIQAGKADRVAFGPYAVSPDYVPVISPLRAGSRITVVAADAGTSAKFAPASGKYAANYALGHPELIPEAAREVFSIDREMQYAPMAEASAHIRHSGGSGAAR